MDSHLEHEEAELTDGFAPPPKPPRNHAFFGQSKTIETMLKPA